MDNKGKLLRRLFVLFLVLALCGTIAGLGLFSLQIVNGEEYRLQSERRLSSAITVPASRGEILDRYGRPLVTNRTVYSLRLDWVFWDKEQQNQTLLKLNNLIVQSGGVIEDSLPITKALPFTYMGEEDSSLRQKLTAFATDNKLSTSLDAAQMIAALREHYQISPNYSDENARIIAGIRYEMDISSFSRYTPFIIARDVSMDLISQIKERHKEFAGVDVEVESVREYQTDAAAHILGRVGMIYRENWEGEDGYKAKGYDMNAKVGIDGAEKAFEEYLRGKDGKKSVETNVSGNVTAEISSVDPQPGNNCILTLDLNLQKATEQALAETLQGISSAEGGAAVVIQVDTGEILAMASYPTYQLEYFNRDYANLLENPLRPMLNRAIGGIYPPGSTFKPMTAVAGLEEGVISRSTREYCRRVTEYLGQRFTCTGYHGSVDVVKGIQKSCNIFFYETGKLLGGEKIEQWAALFGLGQKTGIELDGELAGSVGGPTNRAKMLDRNPSLNPWMPGDVVQAAIGQSDTAVTPLQLANYVATLVNGGNHYEAHLLKSVKSYDYTETVKTDEPVLINTVPMSDSTYTAVMQGMNAVVSEGGTAARTFANYPVKIGGKSGTTQVYGQKINNGQFVAFAPYDNPEIAVCVIGEKAGSGSAMAPAVKKILDAYFYSADLNDNITANYTLVK